MLNNWTNFICKITFGVLAGTVFAAMTTAASAADAGRGRDTFEKRCTGCHSLDKAKVGPRLRGVYGRMAGKDPEFVYSDSVKSASVTWDESTLDRWLTDTESVIPGNDMSFRLNNEDERSDIIGYLKQLSGK